MTKEELDEFYENANEEELLKHKVQLMSFGNIPSANLSTCETYGLSGNCGEKCPKFKDKTCEVYVDTLERLYDETKQKEEKLIEYLKKQIFLYDKDIKSQSEDYKVYYTLIQEEKHKLEIYKDILAKIKSGKYE